MSPTYNHDPLVQFLTAFDGNLTHIVHESTAAENCHIIPVDLSSSIYHFSPHTSNRSKYLPDNPPSQRHPLITMKGIFSRLKSPQALFSSGGPRAKDKKQPPTIDKIPTILHSCITHPSDDAKMNYTLLHVIFSPNQTSSPSYHTATTKTIILLRGSLTLYTAPDGWRDPAALVATELRAGETKTIPAGTLHKFLAGPGGESEAHVRLDPGAPGFERAMLIMAGVVGDGGKWLTGAAGRLVPHVLLMAVYAELMDMCAVGEEQKMLEAAGKRKRGEIDGLKRLLVEKYASDEAVGRAVRDGDGAGAGVV
ncbi:hypothetical protein B0T19DRAFT_487947 [Cercophora scortea]|uniref:Cupin type-1 domain-containing protein n=1 Tax=Cercophora scortea TaxID=314031 RepID=A0AAE0I6T1_9PEZI|nr:hypothetical protein B0T19DRAFT_487947 [Cercophora scortea]